MIKGFRDFILRGNVIDLAVAVVVGAAFTTLVNVFANSLIKPVIGLVFGGTAAAGTLVVRDQVIDYGAVINAVIAFLITAAVVYFVFVGPMNALRKRFQKKDEEEQHDEEIQLLREIRDLLSQQQSQS